VLTHFSYGLFFPPLGNFHSPRGFHEHFEARRAGQESRAS
jgi:hypothetical protein